MSYIKYMLIVIVFLSGCAQQPRLQSPDYKPYISKKDNDYFSKAIASIKTNDSDKAEDILKDLISNNREISGPWLNLGLIYFKKNQYSESEAVINNALNLNPHNPYALNLLGTLERKKGNIQKAHSLYIKAIKYKKNYAIAHYNLALLYDIYFQDINTAAKHYRIYLGLINNEDKQTLDWLEQIQGSIKKL